MKKYYYTDGKSNFGPFSLEELKDKGISEETMVWFQELLEWKTVGSVPELSGLFSSPGITSHTSQKFHPTVQPGQSFPNGTIDLLAFLAMLYWFITNLANFLIRQFIPDWWNSPARYFQIGTNILFAVVPFILALTIKNRILRVISFVFAALITVYILYNNIKMLLQ